jgi:predicted house-cleaning NTP pyrophosphatase (Maf/HAM1 superfamily)
MKISKLMLLSIFLTAAVVAVVGGVVTRAIANKASSATASADPTLVAAYQQREAEYNQTIQQANQQLEKANIQIQQMQQQLTQPKPQEASSAAAAVKVSADQAILIADAVAVAGEQVLKKPELVKYEGKVAYEVAYDKGSVFVDAASGEVLFNGTVPQKISAQKATQVASEYLNEKDVLSVDQITFRNAPLYRVIFSSGMMVYMDMTGQITYIQKAFPDAPKVLVANSNGGSSNNGSGSNTPAQNVHHSDGSEGSDD